MRFTGRAREFCAGWQKGLRLLPAANAGWVLSSSLQRSLLTGLICCCAEYLEVMKDKGLVVRTDVLEVVLQQLEAGEGAAAVAGGSGGGAQV